MKDVIHQLADSILQEWIDNDESAYKDYNDALKAACKQLNAEHKLFVEGPKQCK